jgi:ABC-type lipoprotein release transport system permease subunit
MTSIDVLTYPAGALLLGTVALLSCLLPARRAMRVNPIVVLRQR